MAYFEEMRLSRTAQLDAFNRLRVSLPYTLFEGDMLDDENPLLWQSVVSTGGTAVYNVNSSSMTLTASGTNGSAAISQTKRYLPYQPGKSMSILFTGILCVGTPQSNGTTRFGLFDDAANKTVGTLNGNGLFFELSGTSLRFVVRSSTSGSQVDTAIPQSAWNADKLDGTGPSRVNIDVTKSQIFWIDIEWLGAGTVRFGVLFDGIPITCHEIHHANRMSAHVYMTRATLPVRYEVSTTTGAARSAVKICSTVLSEGLYEEVGRITGAGSPSNVGASCGVAGAVVLGVRLKSAFNRMYAKYVGMDLITTSNSAGRFDVVIVPAANVTGSPTWTSCGSDSMVEYSVNIGTNFAAGTLTDIAPVDVGFFNSQGRSGTSYVPNISAFMASDVAGNSDVMLLLVRSNAGTATMYGALQVQEFR